MARSPRRSDGSVQRRRRRSRSLYILTEHDGDQGMSIYKLNVDDFDSGDAFSEDPDSSDSDDTNSSDSDSTDSYFDSDSDSTDSYFTDSTYPNSDGGASAGYSTNSIDSDGASSNSNYSNSIASESESESESEVDPYVKKAKAAQEHYDSEYDVDSRARRLRHRRLVVRLGTGRGLPETFVAAGTKIVGLSPSSGHATDANFVFDAATRKVSFTPPFRSPKKSPEFWAAGGAVYALDLDRGAGGRSQHDDGKRCSVFERLGPEPECDYESWEWEALPPPPPPFKKGSLVECRAVHPDGATVFMSVRGAGTFSFDGERREWARRGGWILPFDGEAHYVRALGAWVGLCWRHPGRLAACRVADAPPSRPRCKCGRDLLFRRQWRRHAGASLVYMGNAEFCLLETVTLEHQERKDTLGLVVPMLLRVVAFRVQYSWHGELCVVDRRSRVYKLPWSSGGPLAFWI